MGGRERARARPSRRGQEQPGNPRSTRRRRAPHGHPRARTRPHCGEEFRCTGGGWRLCRSAACREVLTGSATTWSTGLSPTYPPSGRRRPQVRAGRPQGCPPVAHPNPGHLVDDARTRHLASPHKASGTSGPPALGKVWECNGRLGGLDLVTRSGSVSDQPSPTVMGVLCPARAIPGRACAEHGSCWVRVCAGPVPRV